MPDLVIPLKIPGCNVVIPEAVAMQVAREIYEKRLIDAGVTILQPKEKKPHEDSEA